VLLERRHCQIPVNALEQLVPGTHVFHTPHRAEPVGKYLVLRRDTSTYGELEPAEFDLAVIGLTESVNTAKTSCGIAAQRRCIEQYVQKHDELQGVPALDIVRRRPFAPGPGREPALSKIFAGNSLLVVELGLGRQTGRVQPEVPINSVEFSVIQILVQGVLEVVCGQ